MLFQHKHHLSPTDQTPSGLPLSFGMSRQGNILEGDGIMRLVGRDSSTYGEVIADQWMNRAELIDFLSHDSWAAQAQSSAWATTADKFRFFMYVAARDAITARSRDRLLALLVERSGHLADLAGVPRKQEDLARVAVAGEVTAQIAAALQEGPEDEVVPLLMQTIAELRRIEAL